MAQSREQISAVLQNELVPLATQVFGEHLISIVVYGSLLKPSFTPGRSDVNVLVVVAESRPDALRELGRRGYALLRRLRITPLVLTRREFESSADVFPMEYMDIAETHQVLHGSDVTEGLDLNRTNLRHQVEHQLRGSLVSLRQLAVAAGRTRPFMKRVLARELEQWRGAIFAILRGLVRLKGRLEAPLDPVELVEEINAEFGLDPGPILRLFRDGAPSDADAPVLIGELLERLSKLVQIVDALEPGGGQS